MKGRSQYYDEMSLSIPGPCLNREGLSGTRNLEAPFVKWLNKNFKIDAEIEMKEQELRNLKADALLKIETMTNEDYKYILIDKYFNHLNCDEIATKIFVSRSTVKRWHKSALSELKL